MIIIPYLERTLASESESSWGFINTTRLKRFTKLLVASVFHVPSAKWYSLNGSLHKLLVWFGWHLGIAACHILSSVQDGGGAPLCIEVERAGNEQPGFAEHPPWANLVWWEELDAAGTPVLETEHFPFLRQAQVAAEALAARETDGGGRGGFHWGTATRGVHFICIGFVLNPQTLLCPSPYTQSCSVQMILSSPPQAMEVQRPRILCCPLTCF